MNLTKINIILFSVVLVRFIFIWSDTRKFS